MPRIVAVLLIRLLGCGGGSFHGTFQSGSPIFQNLVWATAYNLVAIPVAGGVLVRWGVDLPMSIGAVAMSLSTIIVAVNAQLLRRLKLRRAAL
jgi:cation transport ATPase